MEENQEKETKETKQKEAEKVKKNKTNQKNEKTLKETEKKITDKKSQEVKENNKSKNEKTKESIGNKLLKIILVVVLIIAVLIGINTIRNYNILSDIQEQSKKYQTMEEYAYTMVSYDGENRDEQREYSIVKKGAIEKISIKTPDNQEIISWKNTQTNEGLFVVVNTKKVMFTQADTIVLMNADAFINKEMRAQDMKLMSLMSIIYSENLNSQDCYAVNYLGGTTWINKENGLRIKTLQNYRNQDNEKINSYIEFKDWQFENITDEQVAKPDLVGYTIVE